MAERKVFLSVGRTTSPDHASFVAALEARLRAEGLSPCTVGRNTFGADSPIAVVSAVMSECCGAVVVALERWHYPEGIEHPRSAAPQRSRDVRLPTCWNQIEATMAFDRGLPIIVLVEEGVRKEGLLEDGFMWWVQQVRVTTDALATTEFNGVMAAWKDRVMSPRHKARAPVSPSTLTIGELLRALTPSAVYSIVLSATAVVSGAFALGVRFAPLFAKQ